MIKKTHHCHSTESKNQASILFPEEKFPHTPGVVPFFTTRQGGVSQGSWAGFNLGEHVGDRPEHVTHNRQILMQALAPDAHTLAVASQVHGCRVVEAGWSGPPPEADGVVTNRMGLVVGVLTADCVPVLFADSRARVVGAAHAGWRGAVAGVIEETVHAMQQLGASPDQLHAWIGPAIGPASYEVDRTFPEELLKSTENKMEQEWQKFFSSSKKADKVYFDLPGYVLARLIKTGIDATHIINLEQCTYALESIFFSHRRSVQRGENPCGRQLSGIFLLPNP
ncbi:MAG: peptidoglycan editing factor PgeF [Magnetococcales bacterium]|nr:peptidoglycan editing factor PgeF [Magnetococcales bacterium]NGZ05592.1 peptidoglycan editing factor PgeF [Magnetococcales bacterium]